MERGHTVSDDVLSIRVAIADPRRLIAEALASVVAGDAAVDVVTIASGPIAADAIAAAQPDVVLVGVGVDVPGSLGLIDALVSRLPDAGIAIVADRLSRELVSAVLERSLGGLLLTEHPAEDLLASLRDIARGRSVLPSGWQGAVAAAPPGPIDALSERQLEVLRLLAEGCSYEEIGRRLFISVNTVKFHTRSIFERLGVRNRMAAAHVLAESVSNAG